jgi:hypothetical protein|tara:strand:- start:1119 stop:1232 length:114 start_codon:yes stop_codon:yes gene_type:complete
MSAPLRVAILNLMFDCLYVPCEREISRTALNDDNVAN